MKSSRVYTLFTSLKFCPECHSHSKSENVQFRELRMDPKGKQWFDKETQALGCRQRY